MQARDEDDRLFSGQDDADSLFGSPPPSPARGRSPSPALALPGASNVATTAAGNNTSRLGSSTQNVGTIALPGSHHCSEFPIIPLALSLNRVLQVGAPSQSLVIDAANQTSARLAHPAAVTPTINPLPLTPSSSRASSAAPAKKKRVSKGKPRQQESTPRPQITLPDPSEPLPPNFLRNQSALLGTAGVVAGLKPSNLPKRHEQGRTPTNPIVIDEEERPPLLGRRFTSRQPDAYDIDPKLLSTPTTEEIVAMLIGQKDIFPVLEGILRLIAGRGSHAPHKPTGFQRRTPTAVTPQVPVTSSQSTSGAPPSKRRRLHNVPAGAADWDVPYPFQEGEGPEAYKQTWEQERGKQLLVQLMGLIKQAAHKAAARSYFQRKGIKQAASVSRQSMSELPPRDQNIHGHYRPATVTYGVKSGTSTPEPTMSLAQKTSVQSSTPVPYPITPASTPTPPTLSFAPVFPPDSVTPGQSFIPRFEGISAQTLAKSATYSSNASSVDQLITSLLDAAPQTVNGSVNPVATSVTSSSAELQDERPAMSPSTQLHDNANLLQGATEFNFNMEWANDDATVDQDVFDNWMSIFQNFEVPLNTQFGDPSSVEATSGFDAFFGFGLDSGSSSDGVIGKQGGYDTPPTFHPPQWPLAENVLDINPTFSLPSRALNPLTGHMAEPIIDPILVAMSSSDQPHPRNHEGIGHHTNNHEVMQLPQSSSASPIPSISSSSEPYPLTPNSVTWNVSNDSPQPTVAEHNTRQPYGASTGEQDDSSHGQEEGGQKGKGKERERDPSIVSQGSQRTPGLDSSRSDIQTVSSRSASVQPAPRLRRNKAEILKEVRERRKQLSEELKKVRIQLWETTIEQGVLAQLGLI